MVTRSCLSKDRHMLEHPADVMQNCMIEHLAYSDLYPKRLSLRLMSQPTLSFSSKLSVCLQMLANPDHTIRDGGGANAGGAHIYDQVRCMYGVYGPHVISCGFTFFAVQVMGSSL